MSRLTQLIEAANKLRGLDEDDPAKVPLGAMVDEINAIMALPEDQRDAEAPIVKRGPGRPRSA